MAETAAERMSRERRDALILEMLESGAKYLQIQRGLVAAGYPKITTKRIGQIVCREYDQVRSQRRALADRVFDQKLEQLNAIIRANWGVLNAPCRRCSGRGHLGQDPDKPEGVMLVCEECNGDTKHHHPRDRAAASKEVRQAIAEQNRMLGLYAPEKFSFTDSDGNDLVFYDELAMMDIDDLDREWANLNEALEASKTERGDQAARRPLEP